MRSLKVVHSFILLHFSTVIWERPSTAGYAPIKSFFRICIFQCMLLAMIIHDGYSQVSKTDSLLGVIAKDKEDTNKVNHLNSLGWEIMYTNPDTAIILSKQALALSEKLGWKKGKANSYAQLAGYQYLKGNYTGALEDYFGALKMDEDLNNKNGVAADLASIGLVYSNLGEYDKALEYFFKAKRMTEDLGNKGLVAANLNNIASAYYAKKNYPKALDYYQQALRLAEELDIKNGIALTLGNIGNVLKHQNNISGALEYYLRSLEKSEEINDKYNSIAVLVNIGSIYSQIGKNKESEEALKKGALLAKEIGATAYLRDCEKGLSELYESMGKYKESLEHYKLFVIYKDSVSNEENIKKQTRAELQYEFDKKEAATLAETEKEKALTAAESKKQRIIIWAVIIVLLLMIVFATLIFRALRVSRLQKSIIEEKQREILDSIHYARRIQRAIMPKEKYIDRSMERLKRTNDLNLSK